jgi:hypothetical protein
MVRQTRVPRGMLVSLMPIRNHGNVAVAKED